jgi:PAS domain S-box-containing protein
MLTAQPDSPPSLDLKDIDHALDVMEVGLFEWDVGSEALRLSARCRRIWGLPPQGEITLEVILARIHPDDLHLIAIVRDAHAPNGPGCFSIEHRIMLPDGSIRWVQVAGRALFDEDRGRPRALHGHGAMLDITEQKLAEQQLFERSSQLQTFVEYAPVPIAIFDRDMCFVAVSQGAQEELQRSAADLLGRSAYEVFPQMPEDWPAAHRRALEGATESCECELWVGPDGRQEWFRWELHPWRGADDQVGGVILFAELITRRVRAQQELRQSQARLELAREAGALGIFERDLVTGELNWDAKARELWGFGPDETITTEMFYESFHPDDREMFASTVREMAGRGRTGIINLQYRIIHRRDGSIRWISGVGRMLFDGHVRTVGVVRDITERKNAELALERNSAQLRLADERKNAYLAALSHELRSPLAPIRTAAHLLASPRLTAEQVGWVSQVIRRQTQNMVSLLEDLVDVTRISRGRLLLKRSLVSLPGIARTALESARATIDERQHTLVVDLPEVSVYADPKRLSQALAKLLASAAKLTDPEGRIELSATVADAILILHVRHGGTGIPAADTGELFGMLLQGGGEPSQHSGALGIGLSLAEGIVQLHGGTLDVHSDGPGRGCEFLLRLPMRQIAGSGSG